MMGLVACHESSAGHELFKDAGEKLGRFLCTLPGTFTKRPQVFKPAEKKILHLPCHELFSRLRSYDHCVSCRLWGLNFHNLALQKESLNQ